MRKSLLILTGFALAAPVPSIAQQPLRSKTDTLKPEPVFRIVDQMPQFDGDLKTFLNQTLRYPEDAREAKIEGRVVVQFVIEPDGQVTTPRVERGAYPSLDAEAIRIIKLMPRWKPGKQNGHAVRVFYRIPITFKLV